MAAKKREEYTPGEGVEVNGRLGRIADLDADRTETHTPVDLDDGSRLMAEDRHIRRVDRGAIPDAYKAKPKPKARALTQAPRAQHKAVLGPRETR